MPGASGVSQCLGMVLAAIIPANIASVSADRPYCEMAG
jgi:hypothetical protein